MAHYGLSARISFAVVQGRIPKDPKKRCSNTFSIRAFDATPSSRWILAICRARIPTVFLKCSK